MMNRSIVALGVLALLSASPSLGYAHGTGVLRVASKQVALRGTIEMSGEKLGANASLKAELRGVLDTYPIGNVKTTKSQTLAARLVLPPSVPSGTYALVLIAEDGDVAGRTELIIGPLAAAVAAAEGMAHMVGGEAGGMAGMEATGEMMEVAVHTSFAEWAAIVVLVSLSFAGGVSLLVRSRRASEL